MARLNLGPFHGFGNFGAARFAYFFPCGVVVLALGTLHDCRLQLEEGKDFLLAQVRKTEV
jgi:hypothetical protein